jgi:hypothetical protein
VGRARYKIWKVAGISQAVFIDNLKSAVGQKAAKAYLTSIIIVKSLVLESEVELCNDSWMKYINDRSESLSYVLWYFQESCRMLVAKLKESRSCESKLANLLGSQVRGSRRIYLTVLFSSKTIVSQSNVTILSDYSFHIRFDDSCQRSFHRDDSHQFKFSRIFRLSFWVNLTL